MVRGVRPHADAARSPAFFEEGGNVGFVCGVGQIGWAGGFLLGVTWEWYRLYEVERVLASAEKHGDADW